MKITAVKTFFLRHKLARRSGGAGGFYDFFDILIVKLETDGGVCGWGETNAMFSTQNKIDREYAPILIGRDPLAYRDIWRLLWGANYGDAIALGGVAIALDDLRGKILGLSVAELYGGRLRDRVMPYASSVAYVEGVDPEEQYPREAEALAARGFRALKVRIGAEPMKKDLAAIKGVRKAVGDKFILMADGNGAYSLGSAIRMGRELEQLGLYWFEEPLPQRAGEYSGYEALTDKLDIPIAAGEVLGSRGQFGDMIERRRADIVQPDPSLAGGIGECLFIAEMARLWGIACMPHCWAGPLVAVATAHLVSLLPDASWSRTTEPPLLEYNVLEQPLDDSLLTEPLDLRDGLLTVPTKPGLGVDLDEEKMRRYLRR